MRVLQSLTVLGFTLLNAFCWALDTPEGFKRNAYDQYPFLTFSDDYKLAPGAAEVSNLPRVRDQDTLGMCHTFAPAYLLDHKICREKKIANCAATTDREKVSVLDLSRMALGDWPESRTPPNRLGVAGGAPLDPIRKIFGERVTVANEGCAPFSKVLAGYSGDGVADFPNFDIQKAKHAQIQKTFEKYKTQAQGPCLECINEDLKKISQNFPQLSDMQKLKDAFQNSNDIEGLYYQLFYPPECNNPLERYTFNGKFYFFPGDTDRTTPPTIENLKSRMIGLLKANVMVQLSNVCVTKAVAKAPVAGNNCDPKTNPDAVGGHALAVVGYGQFCNSQGVCKEAIKLLNSWGKTWQDQHNDGWVPLDSIMAAIGFPLGQGTLVAIK